MEKDRSPLVKILRKKIIESGETLERFCVACYVGPKQNHIRYDAMKAFLNRGSCSDQLITKILTAGFISQDEYMQHFKWKQKKKVKSLNEIEKNRINKIEGKTQRVESILLQGEDPTE